MKCTLFVASVQVAVSRLPYHSIHTRFKTLTGTSVEEFPQQLQINIAVSACSTRTITMCIYIFIYLFIYLFIYIHLISFIYLFFIYLMFIFIFIFMYLFHLFIGLLFYSLQIQTLGHHAGSISPYGGISSKRGESPRSFTKASKTSGVAERDATGMLLLWYTISLSVYSHQYAHTCV